MGKKVIAYIVVVFISICAIFSFDVLGNSHIKIFVNGEEVVGDVHLINDRTFLPVRAISEALGADVQWDAKKREVHIYQLSNEDSLLPEIIKEVSPSVVAVIGNLKKSASYYGSSYSEEIVHGTGVIIKSTGEILTNAHVVKDIERIVVVLSNGEGFEAVLKNIDEESDLAVIKINKQGLIPAKLGLPSNAGLTITKVKEDSSAKENGLVEGDVILSVNGIKVNNLVDYNETMKNYLPGEQVTVKVNRNGVITDFIITLGN